MTAKEYNLCVDEFADAVYRFILKNIRDEEKAKDIVQDAFEKMWIRHTEIEGTKAKSYLFTAAYHTMIDGTRRDKKLTPYEDSHLKHETVVNGYNDLKEVIDMALEQLPEIQRSVVMLRDYEGYSYEEIGQITGLNESQVKVYIFRARMTLKNYIGKLENVI
jgi:RNA polymerase sigma-70 factor (ECF subfamily)